MSCSEPQNSVTLNDSGNEASITPLGNMFQCFTSSALLFDVVNSYDRITNPLYFQPLPFSPAPNNTYHSLLQTASNGCFTPSVSTSIFNLAPSEDDNKLYAEASLLEMGTGTQGLSREGAGARGTI